jgi:glycosyltransferase involved in cell wall biosynthesis
MTHSAMQWISSGGFYGAERVVIELAAFLRDAGWDSHVAVLESPGAAEVLRRAGDLGLKTCLMPGGKKNFWAALARLRAYVTGHEIQIVHSHGFKSDVYSALTPLPSGTRRIATCHNWLSRNSKLKLYEWLDKQALRKFERVVLVSPQLVEDVRRAGLSPQRTVMIENGIAQPAVEDASALARLRESLGIAPDEKMILQVGRLEPAKGNERLVRACAGSALGGRARVVFAGEGEDRRRLTSLAQELGMEKQVVFAGYRRDIAALLQAADVFCISSLSEGLPIVLLEAMASGAPVVATAVGAIPDVIRDGDNGWLVPSGDVDALRRALEAALAGDGLARARAERARRDYQKLYSRDAMGEKYLAVYRQAMAVDPAREI